MQKSKEKRFYFFVSCFVMLEDITPNTIEIRAERRIS
jgi:hypothetical protein